MNLTDDCFDFDLLFKKVDECFPQPVDSGNLFTLCPGPWICTLGSARKGAPEELIKTIKRSAMHITRCFNSLEIGEDNLAWGELKFFQGDLNSARTYITRVLDRTQGKQQFEIVHRLLLYIMRIAVSHGDYSTAEQARQEVKAQLDEADYLNRYVNYDIFLAWYYYIMDLPEKMPEWIQDNFSPYIYASFIENFANQVKARYCYMTRNYPPLLAYIHEMKQRESYLFGRIEMLAIEACVHYKMKDKNKACIVLAEAYENAAPNNIVMPFIELGKDMRTLTSYALKASGCNISRSWLESVRRKSASYAKRRAHVIVHHKQAKGMTNGIVLSPREAEILSDLSHGLSRSEIAASRNLSVNTVKMVINNVYFKLGAENLAGAIRIAAERKMI